MGRSRELAILGAALEDALAGRGALVSVTGEPGIGKTRLAQALAAEARGRGLAVARGAAWDGGGAPSHWPWIEVLRSLRGVLPEPDEGLRRALGPLWEPPAAGAPAGDPELAEFRRLDALRAVLGAASGRGLVVVLEDLHAADPGTLEALRFVARTLGEERTLVLATWREGEADPRCAPLLARIAAAATLLRPARLGADDVGELLADLEPVTARLAEDIHRRSGGNPLFVQEILQHVRAGGAVDELPERVGAAVAERLGRLAVPEREVLEAAAVLGPDAPIALVGRLAGVRGADLELRLQGALRVGVAQRSGEVVGFAHPLYRERLLADVAPERRAALHLAAAEALEGVPGSGVEERAARHLLAASPAGDPARALSAALRASHAAELAATPVRAAELLEAALRLEAREAAPRLRQEVQLRLAELSARGGAGVRARELAREVASHARAAGDAELLARAALAHGAELRVGVVDPALVAVLEEALRSVPTDQTGLRARLLARLAAALQPAPDPGLPIRLAREAVALARASGDADVLAGVLHAAGSALGAYAPPAERLPLSRELYRMARARGDLVVAQRAVGRMAIDASEVFELGEAAGAAAAHEALGAALGHARWRWSSPLLASMCALAEGRWDESAAALAVAEERARSADDPNAETFVYLHRAGVLRSRAAARPEEAERTLRVVPAGLADQAPMNALMRASLLARLGELEAARQSLAVAQPGWTRGIPVGLVTEADAAMRVGDRGRAAELLPLVQQLDWPALSWGVYGYIWDGPVGHWLGGVLAVLARWDEAIAALDAAAAAAAGAGARPVAADVRCTLARALLGRGREEDRARAAELLDDVSAEAGALGMAHLSARAEEARAGASRAPRRRPPPTDPARPSTRSGRAGLDAPAPEIPTLSLARDGEVWTVRFGDRTALLKHSRGLEMLDALVQAPERELHVLALAGGDRAEPVDAGDGGELLDPRARAAYRARVAELDEELRQAEAWNDVARRERLAAELAFLRDELAHGLSLGGRARRAAGAVERARVNVQKRLRSVIRRVTAVLPEAGRHLEQAIRTGVVVSYRP